MVKRQTLASSIQKRNVELLTIAAEEKEFTVNSGPNDQLELKSRRAIVIMARVHPGESPSSFVCQGFIDFLVSTHPIAKVLRDYLVFKVVPMINPDGVFVGNYR